MANLVVKKFYGTYCQPCRALNPVFDELRGVYPSVTFQNVDVDNSPELTQQYGVRSVPTVVFEKNGQEIRRLVGLNPKSTYVNIINQNI